jgi:regulator of ribonuclease activity A
MSVSGFNTVKTADLCDQFAAHIQVVVPIFRDYGSVPSFSGQIVTVKVHEDNALVRKILQENGDGKVLVIDGGGSLRCGLVGDQLAAMARDHSWSGIVVYGCIRDAREMAEIGLGVKALNTNPFRSAKWGAGERNITVNFAGVHFTPGYYLYADQDGILVADKPLI